MLKNWKKIDNDIFVDMAQFQVLVIYIEYRFKDL